jgi:hypothetical protein
MGRLMKARSRTRVVPLPQKVVPLTTLTPPAILLECAPFYAARPLRTGVAANGAWLSLARALGSGPRGRWFKSSRPDFFGNEPFGGPESTPSKGFLILETEDTDLRACRGIHVVNKLTRSATAEADRGNALVFEEVRVFPRGSGRLAYSSVLFRGVA